jgi:superfamily II DNA or RNA helicase
MENKYIIHFKNDLMEDCTRNAFINDKQDRIYSRFNVDGEEQKTHVIEFKTVPFFYTLRKHQLEWFKKIIKYDSGIINLSTSSGKTILALSLANFYFKQSNLKTCILVDRHSLKEQWVNVLKNLDYQPDVFLIQTIISRNIILADSYDVLIVDEVHSFTSLKRHEWFIKNKHFIKMFGMSATLEKKLIFLQCHFSKIIVSNIFVDKKQSTFVHLYKFKNEPPLVHTMIKRWTKQGIKEQINYTGLLGQLSESEFRTNKMAELINYYLDENKDRNILVISERIIQLEYLYEIFKDKLETCLVTSKHYKSQKEKFKTSRLILGISSIVSQGFNVPHLNCLFFCLPKKTIKQTIGRIFRQEHFNITPLIIDVIDEHPVFQNQFYQRKRQYKLEIKNPIFEYKQ